jgi:hypothetical protein
LDDLGTIWLNGNKLQGSIPGSIFGSLPKLVVLYLQDNEFTGEIPGSLLDSGSLGNIYTYIMLSWLLRYSLIAILFRNDLRPRQPLEWNLARSILSDL